MFEFPVAEFQLNQVTQSLFEIFPCASFRHLCQLPIRFSTQSCFIKNSRGEASLHISFASKAFDIKMQSGTDLLLSKPGAPNPPAVGMLAKVQALPAVGSVYPDLINRAKVHPRLSPLLGPPKKAKVRENYFP